MTQTQVRTRKKLSAIDLVKGGVSAKRQEVVIQNFDGDGVDGVIWIRPVSALEAMNASNVAASTTMTPEEKIADRVAFIERLAVDEDGNPLFGPESGVSVSDMPALRFSALVTAIDAAITDTISPALPTSTDSAVNSEAAPAVPTVPSTEEPAV